MSPSIRTMGFFMSEINFCNTKEQLSHLGEVVTGKVDGSPSGADIDTSTLPYTGQVRKTLPALEAEYQEDIDNFVQVSGEVITSKTDEFNEAIQAAGGVSVGVWTSGVTTFNAYNEYAVYNGIPYKPRTTATFPYVAQGADPTTAPDDANVQPYQETDYGTVSSGVKVQHRRGTDAEILSGTPDVAELWFNTSDSSIHMGDGTTEGGVKNVTHEALKNYTEPANNAAFGRPGVQYIAHRGLSQFAPENTLPAYEAAGRGGFFGGECDIQVCATGEWVLMHDLTVDRTTDGTGQVPSLTLSYLKSLDAGSWFSSYYSGTRVPTLVEYLKTCKRFGLTPVPEVKSATYSDTEIENLINNCLSVFPDYQFVIISFDLVALKQIRAKDSNVRLQLVVMTYTEAEVDNCINLGKCDIDARWINMPSDLSYAKENGILINTWTVNTPDEAESAIDAGVKFITSDYINYGE